MESIHPSLFDRFTALQADLWQQVSLRVSETAGQALTIGGEVEIKQLPLDALSTLEDPVLLVRFAFGDTPENTQLLWLSEETAKQLLKATKSVEAEAFDESHVGELRTVMESLVQGICVGITDLHGGPVVATGLSVRFQQVEAPENFQSAETILHVEAPITASGVEGKLFWMLDPSTCGWMLGESEGTDAGRSEPFGSLEAPTSFGGSSMVADTAGIELLLDIPLEISVELGRLKMLIRDVLDLGTGSIVEIDRAAGEPVDVMVNGRLVAKGEVVVIEDNFGVRITEILTPQERLEKLNEVA